MTGILDLRGLPLPEVLSRIVETLDEVDVEENLEFVLDRDVDVNAITTHLSDYAEFDAENRGNFLLLRLTKKAEFEAVREEDEELKIDENTNVGKLIERYPEAIDILASYGFTPLKNPVLRKTLARTITLGRAKILKGLGEEEFKEMLEKLKALQR